MVSKTILVIEDEEFISNSIVKALKKEGYGVITTSDYGTSINVINGAQIDLVVSDVMLPFAGGIDIVEHIKNSPKLSHIPILLVTGMDREILYSSKIPAEAIISKPFDMAQLVALVNANIIKAAVDIES